MIRFHHDFETWSEVDLPKANADVYSRHPSTEVLMLSYARDDGPVKQWVPAEGEPMPAEVEDAMLDERVTKFAWNSAFEYMIWRNVLGIEVPYNQWRDPMVLSFSLSMPGTLAKAGEVAQLPEKMIKLPDGKRLINRFSKPNRPTRALPGNIIIDGVDKRRIFPEDDPEKWERYKLYNRIDTESERKFWKRLAKYDLPQHEWELWFLDREINQRGLPVNRPVIRNIVDIRDQLMEERRQELRDLTGLSNPNSVAQFLPFVQRHGYPFDSLAKARVRRAYSAVEQAEAKKPYKGDPRNLRAVARHMRDHNSPPVLKRALELRLQTTQTSMNKLDTMLRASGSDGLIRDTLQFAGAGRTWRWSGRVVQTQNLKRPHYLFDTPASQVELLNWIAEADKDEVVERYGELAFDVLSSCIRGVIQAPKGYVFIISDLNAIENRGVGWLAGDRKILRVFEEGKDPYLDFATYMFGITYAQAEAEKKAGDGYKRKVAKPGVLGCGYMLSGGKEFVDHRTGEIEATGLLAYGRDMGIDLGPELAEKSVQIWRETYTGVVGFWDEIKSAAWKTIRTGEETECGWLTFLADGPFLKMMLPSGRCLHYVNPRIMPWKMPWGKTQDSITYEQLENNQWRRICTHPGKLTENATQAVARDVLAHGLKRCQEEGLDVRLHVHDEVIAMVKEEEAEEKLQLLNQCLEDQPRWARGFPLAAEGVISKIYVKD